MTKQVIGTAVQAPILDYPKGQLISKCRLDQNINEIFSKISALTSKKRLNQKLYYTNHVK